MRLSLESRAFGWAVLASFLSMGGAWLMANPIGNMAGTSSAQIAEVIPEMTPSPELTNQGGKYFGESCSQCHGDDAHGDEGPDLHNLSISNGHIASMIRKGIKGEMPSFAKKYNDQQVAALVSYLRSLR